MEFRPMAAQPSVAERLRETRRALLDLSTRNRLLNTPRRTRSSSIEIVEGNGDEVFRRLMAEHKSYGFSAGVEAETAENDDPHHLTQPDDETEAAPNGLRRRRSEALQTQL